MNSARRSTVLTVFAALLAGMAAPALAVVQREDIVMLAADGHHYTSYTTLRSEFAQRALYLAPGASPDDASFIVPSDYQVAHLKDGRTRLRFGGGSYAIMQAQTFPNAQLRTADNGDLIYRSGRGDKRSDGHFGKWNAPGKFDSFVYSWVAPANITIVAYKANRDGQWRRRGRTLSWHGEQVNNIVFTIRYRVNKPNKPKARAPKPAAAKQPRQPPPRAKPPQRPPAPRRTGTTPGPGASLDLAPASGIQALPEKLLRAQQRGQTKPAPKPKPKPKPAVSRTHNGVALTHMVVFVKGRPVVTDRGQTVLDRLAKRLKDRGARKVIVTGPSVTNTRDLGGSAAQAARVGDELNRHGVSADRIETRWGAHNKTGAGQDTVTITVQPPNAIAGFLSHR